MPATPATPSFSTPTNRHSELLRLCERKGAVLSVSPLSLCREGAVSEKFTKFPIRFAAFTELNDVDVNPLIAERFYRKKALSNDGKERTREQ